MKKLLLLTFFLLTIFSFFARNSLAHAEDVLSEETKVNYELVYPGILPGHPLYFLKAARDNILGFFITNPLKKTEFNLLMSDKRLVSAQMLFENGEIDLAIETLSKSGNYFHKALQKISEAEKQGLDTGTMSDRLLTASLKHVEIILELEKRAKGNAKENFQIASKRAEEFHNSVEKFKSENQH